VKNALTAKRPTRRIVDQKAFTEINRVSDNVFPKRFARGPISPAWNKNPMQSTASVLISGKISRRAMRNGAESAE